MSLPDPSVMERPLVLLPAVDVAGGQAVRLVQGEAGSETGYGDPIAAARDWADQGASWIHLVDLDAAFGRGSNLEVIRAVIDRVEDVRVELSGGIRDDASLEAALATGAQRVNLGTAALEDPAWTERVIALYGDRIAVGLDVRGTTLAARGWTREGGDLWEVLDRLEQAGCARYVVTDVTKDGTLAGPNLELLAAGARAHRQARRRLRRHRDARRPPPPPRRSRTPGWRARSSARRSTPAPSRSPRPSPSRRCDRPAAADSAGQPFAGRAFEASPWTGDDGTAPAAYAAALAAFRAGEAGPEAVVDALREVRLLVPLLAEVGEVGRRPRRGSRHRQAGGARARDGRGPGRPAGAARVLLRGGDDAPGTRRRARCRRPARQVALGAASDGTELVVIDPATDRFGLRRSALEALARDLPWTAPWLDPEVGRAIRRAVADEPAVTTASGRHGRPACVARRRRGAGRDRAARDPRPAAGRRADGPGAAPLDRGPDVRSRVDSMTVRLEASFC